MARSGSTEGDIQQLFSAKAASSRVLPVSGQRRLAGKKEENNGRFWHYQNVIELPECHSTTRMS